MEDFKNNVGGGDVLLFQTENDGDIIDNFYLTQGLETAIYLSLFGGNMDDDGSRNNKKSWWANAYTDTEEEKQVSRFQNLLESLPATSSNLKRLNDAILADLNWLSGVEVIASIPKINRVNFSITVDNKTFEITEEWATS